MSETSDKRPIQIKKVGIYIIIILALLRFLIFPLRGNIQEKKAVLGEQQETYNIKYQTFERQKETRVEKTGAESGVDKDTLFLHLYEKGTSNSYIYSEILERVTKIAEGKGLTVVNFETLEPVAGKTINEVPIVVRLRGQPAPFIEVLDALKKSEKLLSIRSTEITRAGQEQLFSVTITALRVEM